MNRLERRRAKSKKLGGTQLHHTTMGGKLKAEQDEKAHNKRAYKGEE
jgi:hypothetical protein